MTIMPGTPSQEWCEGCLTAALLRFPVLQLTNAGVSHIGTFPHCPRCNKENPAL